MRARRGRARFAEQLVCQKPTREIGFLPPSTRRADLASLKFFRCPQKVPTASRVAACVRGAPSMPESTIAGKKVEPADPERESHVLRERARTCGHRRERQRWLGF